jgi:hypothetical protein
MGRYANQLIRLDFPDLSEDDDPIYVTIRNPKTVPSDTLMPKDDVPEGPDGKPDSNAAISASYGVMAELVVDWHVYDALAPDDSPPLDLPVTPEKLRKLPFEILQRIAGEMNKVLATPQ